MVWLLTPNYFYLFPIIFFVVKMASSIYKQFPKLFGLSVWLTFYANRRSESNCLKKQIFYPFLSRRQYQSEFGEFGNIFLADPNDIDFILNRMRAETTGTKEFRDLSYRLVSLLAEKALILDEKKEVMKLSPLGKFTSLIPITRSEDYCFVLTNDGVTAFQSPLLRVAPDCKISLVLYDEFAHQVVYSKLPAEKKDTKFVIMCSVLNEQAVAIMIIKHLLQQGIRQDQICLAAMLSHAQAVKDLASMFGEVKFLLGWVDPAYIKSIKQVAPGLGSFERRFNGLGNQ